MIENHFCSFLLLKRNQTTFVVSFRSFEIATCQFEEECTVVKSNVTEDQVSIIPPIASDKLAPIFHSPHVAVNFSIPKYLTRHLSQVLTHAKKSKKYTFLSRNDIIKLSMNKGSKHQKSVLLPFNRNLLEKRSKKKHLSRHLIGEPGNYPVKHPLIETSLSRCGEHCY